MMPSPTSPGARACGEGGFGAGWASALCCFFVDRALAGFSSCVAAIDPSPLDGMTSVWGSMFADGLLAEGSWGAICPLSGGGFIVGGVTDGGATTSVDGPRCEPRSLNPTRNPREKKIAHTAMQAR